MPEHDAQEHRSLRAARSQPQHTPDVSAADATQVTNNPTVRLGRQEESDGWINDPGADALEGSYPSHPLQAATEDLWALSTTNGTWRSTPGDGQSDFLVLEPHISALTGSEATTAPGRTPGGPSAPLVSGSRPIASTPLAASSASVPPASSSAGNSWSARGSLPYDDPLRRLSLEIQAAIEQHLAQQGEALPLERTPDHADLIRRLTLNYLRHDRAAAETIPDATEAERLLAAVSDEVLGYGPLDPLLRDDSVSEIMVTGAHMTYVEQGGRLHEVPVHFADDAHLLRIIHKLLAPLGLAVTQANPIAHGRLADGSRVTVVIPPSSISGPSLTIRRAVRRAFTLEQLVRLDALSLHMADFLRLCVSARLNIIICGIAGSGKTTILNALASSIDEHERLVTIEETAELQLHHRHLVRLEAVPPHQPGGALRKHELLAHALHLLPERIILGEITGGEALTIIQAMNTGCDGTLATMYANSPRDALHRLEALCLSAGPMLSSLAVRQQIATGLDLLLFCARLRDGTRRVLSVTDISGMEGDVIAAHDLFVFREAGLDMATGRIRGEFAATGQRPSFASRIEDAPAPGFAQHYPRGA
jgi:pilus assembly protein CpaF